MKEVVINGEKMRTALSVDAIGLFCPMPVVKLKLGLEKVNIGDVVELLADDPGVKDDIPSWCKETGNTILSLEQDAEIFHSGSYDRIYHGLSIALAASALG